MDTLNDQARDLPWVQEALRLKGLREIPGARHEPEIVQMWKDIKRGGIKDDETPWCAAFVGACLERSGIRSTRFESARSYVGFGESLPHLEFGSIVVFSRKGGGHVGFCVGVDAIGNPFILGGNQSNAVNILPFDKSRILAIRWPSGYAKSSSPLLVSSKSGKFSANEA